MNERTNERTNEQTNKTFLSHSSSLLLSPVLFHHQWYARASGQEVLGNYPRPTWARIARYQRSLQPTGATGQPRAWWWWWWVWCGSEWDRIEAVSECRQMDHDDDEFKDGNMKMMEIRMMCAWLPTTITISYQPSTTTTCHHGNSSTPLLSTTTATTNNNNSNHQQEQEQQQQQQQQQQQWQPFHTHAWTPEA